ncbi:sulfatase-like hydrolase/transferase [Rhodocytophaga rosea]|uniref:Sulfatase-like hydrolase/transferase n=1 Tax=Rhodocytophaga rosea TaxID=2704465 RepID=A0A6C0GFW7_9BACT|nr:sulfatase-like hydrolase/transferase [Rhodocytophaga rosea]QHT66683.1 sulfatase-like hydrolase/transferase [Rhodocytophaga rosea]
MSRFWYVIFFCCCFITVTQAQPLPSKPNIIYIVADDMGYGDLSSYGRNDYQTPNLDKFARQGIRFLQAYAAAPVCTPSRTGFITGRYPARTQVGLWEPLTGQGMDEQMGLTSEQATVSSMLKANGYQTVLIGKWHLGKQPQHHPNKHGFVEFYGVLEGAADYVSHQPGLYHNQDSILRKGYLTDLFTEQAVAFIAQKHPKPFFMSLQYTAPHWPWQGPSDVPYADSLDWRSGGSAQIYAQMIQRLDTGIGQIMASLHQNGLEENTLVIFTSDNGGEQFSQMGPFRGKKMELWEGGIRVPAIVRWPNALKGGEESKQVVISMDWTATILAAAGVTAHPNYPLDGMNLLPVCQGKVSLQSRQLAWRTFQRTKQKAFRSGDWKYLHDGKAEYLFNLALDPSEEYDVKNQQPQKLAQLKALYQQWDSQMLPPLALP